MRGENQICQRFYNSCEKSWWNILRMDIQCMHWTTNLIAEQKWWKIRILQTDILQHPPVFSVGTARSQELEDNFYALGHFSPAPCCVNTTIKFSDTTRVTAIAKQISNYNAFWSCADSDNPNAHTGSPNGVKFATVAFSWEIPVHKNHVSLTRKESTTT